ncbi:MAG: nucleotidyltransferase domain-containing protein [Bryobacteraceae bacterium]|nr:nucleotidyltransferase domain-containing protein [Bryobacteraceae bacterium]
MVTNSSFAVSEEVIQEATRRLVESFKPSKLYLFGSAARGEAGPDSDLDFCMVVSDDAPPEVFRAGASHAALSGMKTAIDVVPWRRTDFEQRAAWVKASLPATVIREGRLLYDAE